MGIRVSLNHATTYSFDRAVAFAPHVLRLRPAPHCRTPIQAYSLKVSPEKHFINWQQDPFGNYLARLVFNEKAAELSIEVDIIADMTVINPFDFFLEDYAEQYPFQLPTQLFRELTPYMEIRESGPQLLEWLQSVDRTKRRTVDFLADLNRKLQKDIDYVVRMEPGVQNCEESLERRKGSCRDSAWLLVQICRHLGLASRFVSGYIVQLVADVKALDGPSGTAVDFTDLHAWTEVYLPGAGWVGLDPTSGLFAGEGHIPLACTPEPSSAAPVTGSTDVCKSDLNFSMKLTRVHEDPRVTKPYTEEQWTAIDSLGAAVDEDLIAHDVRLTMGGEPTFVSIDDMDGAEWTTAALGKNKRLLAGQLLNRLRDRLAPKAVLHHGQGKWYPGEELPRWGFSIFWRKDGEPVWDNKALLADETTVYNHGLPEAEKFIKTLTHHLGVEEKWAIPAWEDVYYYLWKEGTLPVNVDPFETNLEDSSERKRLREVLEQGLAKSTGYALPLRWKFIGTWGQWESGDWPMRRGRMHLIPGDSPMGYRLPIHSLPYFPQGKKALQPQRHPFDERGNLGDIVGEVARRYQQRRPLAPAEHPIEEQHLRESWLPENVVGTALCVEPRNGRLYVFLPPVSHLEHFLELIACIEHTAQELNLPVLLEGYPPPHDWRLWRLKITPDPGVIEVNVIPSSTWSGIVDITSILYEEARLCRLGTEKFMLDGRHTGTGGGNHVTLGGDRPSDSPLLRRPDLLRSLVNFWQHHPSLSYLFSGLFIGPTSQAPRVDEARHESLYELEIAFSQMPPGQSIYPWMVDRLLRNLLVDITGNTHRAEFCIDKLYSPDSLEGRLGIVEFRAFEMPPHPRMSLVQILLLRSLIARFWKTPYNHPLVRWGTQLHDKFMLPYHLWQDLADVVNGMQRAGYPFQLEWFAPFFEFRFPVAGAVQLGDMQIELRTAAEPWHVLGEETTAGGTARYVDSSVERLQVHVSGMTDPRHVVACNGRRVPLRPTGTQGEFVGGVRYRAWQPPSALHPTIGVHTPLVFDMVDIWNGCAIGGCTYHVSHPGGRSFDQMPVNAYEAESRRLARFWSYGHTAGPMLPPPEEPNRDYPYTLDLRRRLG